MEMTQTQEVPAVTNELQAPQGGMPLWKRKVHEAITELLLKGITPSLLEISPNVFEFLKEHLQDRYSDTDLYYTYGNLIIRVITGREQVLNEKSWPYAWASGNNLCPQKEMVATLVEALCEEPDYITKTALAKVLNIYTQ